MTTADENFPDVQSALRDAWLATSRQVQACERARDAADDALRAAQAKAAEVRRQIEAACPPLGLDPVEVMAPAASRVTPSAAGHGPHRPIEDRGPKVQYEERVADLLADGRLVAGEPLRTVHHGGEYFARVEADGSVSGPDIGSRSTLSAAARALVGGERNGWKFWHVQRDSGWVPVADLRNG